MPRLYMLKIFTQPITYKIGVTDQPSIGAMQQYYNNIVNIQVLYFGREFDRYYKGTAEREIKTIFFDNYFFNLSPVEQYYNRVYTIGQIYAAEAANHVEQVLARVFLHLDGITDEILEEQNMSESETDESESESEINIEEEALEYDYE